jgi:hypothetical protein
VILVLAHLAGTVHAMALGGSHLELAATVCAQRVQPDPDVASGWGPAHLAGAPAHHHSTGEGHVEHPADRPRAAGPAVRDTPDPDVLTKAQPAFPVQDFTCHGSCGPALRQAAPKSPATRSLLCVWRQ